MLIFLRGKKVNSNLFTYLFFIYGKKTLKKIVTRFYYGNAERASDKFIDFCCCLKYELV